MKQIGLMPAHTPTSVIDQRLTSLHFVALHQAGRIVLTGEEKHKQNHSEASYGTHAMRDTSKTTKTVAIQNPSTSGSNNDWLSRRKDTSFPRVTTHMTEKGAYDY